MKRLVALVALALIVPASACAADWKNAGTIDPRGSVETAVDAAGNSVFAYGSAGLFVRSRPRGGPFAPPQKLSDQQVYQYSLAANARGEAAVVWSDGQFEPGPRELVALRTPAGSFTPPQTLLDGTRSCDPERAAFSDSGYAVVVFNAAQPGENTCLVYASVRAPGSGEFEPPVQLSTANSQAPQVAIDKRGNALVLWSDDEADAIQVVRYLPRDGGFQAPQSVVVPGEKPGPGWGPLLLRVSAPTGAAIIAFPSLGADGRRPAAAIGSTTAGFGPASGLAGPSSLNSEDRFEAAAGADGTLAVVWRGGPRRHRVKIARVGPGAESITSLDTNTISGLHVADVAVAIADGGRVTVAWSRLSAHGKRSTVEAATCAPSERCGKSQHLSFDGPAYGAVPDVATSSAGDQFTAWVTPSGVEWAKAPKRSGKFGKARLLAKALGYLRPSLYRSSRGAMLATVQQGDGSSPPSARLFTYNER
jgi:hypothetical protein